MKLSIIIPTYTITKELEEFTLSLLASIRDNIYYEIIICEDGGIFSLKLANEADVYVYSQENLGFVKNVNRGISIARGDYIAVVNSDIILNRGNLLDLCIPDMITSPITINQDVPLLAGHFFVFPKSLGIKLDERLKMFCSDAILEYQFKDKITQVPTVKVYHELNQTIKQAELLDGEQLDEDRKIATSIICDKLPF